MSMNVNYAKQIVPAQAISGTTPIHGIFPGALDFSAFGFQMITTGTVAGTWIVEASNNYIVQGYDAVSATGTWDDVTSLLNATPTVAAGSPTDQYRQIAAYAGRAIRVTFTPSSGAGNVQCFMTAKAVS
jgi:hypothetical protein